MKETLAWKKEETCVKCEEFVARYSKHCFACGASNPNFDYSTHGKEWLDFYTRECMRNHPERRLDALCDLTLKVDMPFCDVCGKRLNFQQN